MGYKNLLYSNTKKEIEFKKERIYYFIYGGFGFAIGIVASTLFLIDILAKCCILSIGVIFDFPLILGPIFLIGALVLLVLSSLFLLMGIKLTEFRIYQNGITFPRWRLKDVSNPRFINFDGIEKITVINNHYIIVKMKDNVKERRKLLYYLIPNLSLSIENFKDLLKDKVEIDEQTRNDRDKFIDNVV